MNDHTEPTSTRDETHSREQMSPSESMKTTALTSDKEQASLPVEPIQVPECSHSRDTTSSPIAATNAGYQNASTARGRIIDVAYADQKESVANVTRYKESKPLPAASRSQTAEDAVVFHIQIASNHTFTVLYVC